MVELYFVICPAAYGLNLSDFDVQFLTREYVGVLAKGDLPLYPFSQKMKGPYSLDFKIFGE